MIYQDFFPTPLIAEQVGHRVDNDRLHEKVLNHAQHSESVYFSNVGGEQYHGFRDRLFCSMQSARQFHNVQM